VPAGREAPNPYALSSPGPARWSCRCSVELLRFFDKFTSPAPAGDRTPAEDSASLADFGNEDVAEAEAEIASGAPLQIPDVPAIPELPMEVSDGKLAAAGADAADHAALPEPGAVGGHDDDAGPGR